MCRVWSSGTTYRRTFLCKSLGNSPGMTYTHMGPTNCDRTPWCYIIRLVGEYCSCTGCDGRGYADGCRGGGVGVCLHTDPCESVYTCPMSFYHDGQKLIAKRKHDHLIAEKSTETTSFYVSCLSFRSVMKVRNCCEKRVCCVYKPCNLKMEFWLVQDHIDTDGAWYLSGMGLTELCTGDVRLK